MVRRDQTRNWVSFVVGPGNQPLVIADGGGYSGTFGRGASPASAGPNGNGAGNGLDGGCGGPGGSNGSGGNGSSGGFFAGGGGGAGFFGNAAQALTAAASVGWISPVTLAAGSAVVPVAQAALAAAAVPTLRISPPIRPGPWVITAQAM
jgi:hypothetical protein